MQIFANQKTCRVFLFLFLLFYGFMLSAQVAEPAQAPSVVVDETTPFPDTVSAAGTAVPASSTNIWIFLRVVLVLAIVCAGIYGVVYFLKKTTKINTGNDPYMKTVAALSLSPNKSVRIFTVGTQAFIIGVTDQAISLISEITDKELIDSMNLESDKNSTVPLGSFSSVLGSFLPKKLRGNTSGEMPDRTETVPSDESASALATSDFLRKQRDRLKNGGPQ